MSETPRYLVLLSEGDRSAYLTLRSYFCSSSRKSKRIERFDEMLVRIKAFCVKNDGDDWKRCLVCGICWLGSAIAVNIRSLCLLMGRCKSSVNGTLQKYGFNTKSAKNESLSRLTDAIPQLREDFPELRRWTLRSEDSLAKRKSEREIHQRIRDIPHICIPCVVSSSHDAPQPEKEPPKDSSCAGFCDNDVETLPLMTDFLNDGSYGDDFGWTVI